MAAGSIIRHRWRRWTIVVDGQVRSVRTNQRAVDNILREAGIQIEADDIVGPTLGSALADDQQSTIYRAEHARPVSVQADGQTQQFQSPDLAAAGNSDAGHCGGARVRSGHCERADSRSGPARVPTPSRAIRAIDRPFISTFNAPVPNHADAESHAGEQKDADAQAKTVGAALSEVGVQSYLADRKSGLP